MKIEEIRSKTDSELEFDIVKLQKDLFHLKFKAAYDSASSTAKFIDYRRSIARIHTVLHERASGIRGQQPK